MKTLIKSVFLSLIVFGIIGFKPIISYANDLDEILANYDFSDYAVDIDNLSDFNGSMVKEFRITKYTDYWLFCNLNDNIFNDSVFNVGIFESEYRFARYVNENTLELYRNTNNNTVYSFSGFRYYYSINTYDNGVSRYQLANTAQLNNVNSRILYTNIPIFVDKSKMYEYLLYGTYDTSDIKNADYVESPNNSNTNNIGHIKQTGYKYNPSNFRSEIITWDKTKSSTNYEYQSTDTVNFYLKDRSWKSTKNNIGALGAVSELVDWGSRQLTKFVYPKGSNEYLLASGGGVESSSYGKMIKVGGISATSGSYGVDALASLQNNSLDNDMANYVRSTIGSSDKRSYYDKAYQWFTGNEYVYQIAYDIYAVIEDGSGNKGTWYKINFHDTPIQERDDRLDGGVTVKPVNITFPSGNNPDSGDWVDFDETPIDDDRDEEDNEVINYINTSVYNDNGDTYNITNNYTYNYDNRSWVENHYNNEDISEVNEGLEWIKLFPAFFGLFLTMFGAFLPGWAVVVVTIAIPIICGLLVFKIIKGVIPFV